MFIDYINIFAKHLDEWMMLMQIKSIYNQNRWNEIMSKNMNWL